MAECGQQQSPLPVSGCLPQGFNLEFHPGEITSFPWNNDTTSARKSCSLSTDLKLLAEVLVSVPAIPCFLEIPTGVSSSSHLGHWARCCQLGVLDHRGEGLLVRLKLLVLYLIITKLYSVDRYNYTFIVFYIIGVIYYMDIIIFIIQIMHSYLYACI